jgi:hypothetical protein
MTFSRFLTSTSAANAIVAKGMARKRPEVVDYETSLDLARGVVEDREAHGEERGLSSS